MNNANELIPTRESLLSRLKNRDDQEGWKDFFDTYWRLIYNTAMKAGLNDAEAQDVVQETILGVLKRMPTFEYRGEQGSFKSWLLQLTRWRIGDQKRRRDLILIREKRRSDTSTGTSAIEQAADPADSDLDAVWEKEWEANLMEAALERLKRKIDSKAYQVFDLYVFKGWSVTRVARAMKVSSAFVYLVKHRTNKLLKKEILELRNKPI